MATSIDVHWLADRLFEKNIISENEKREATDTITGCTTYQRISTLLDIVRATVKLDISVFHQFIDILSNGTRREITLSEKLLNDFEAIKSKIHCIFYHNFSLSLIDRAERNSTS